MFEPRKYFFLLVEKYLCKREKKPHRARSVAYNIMGIFSKMTVCFGGKYNFHKHQASFTIASRFLQSPSPQQA